jgi:transcriptional regulator with XRE-family HTH domain
MGGRIRAARESLGLGQQELAERVGVHFMSVSRWELGKQAIGGTSLIELGRALGVSADWLSSGDGPMPSFIREDLIEDVSRDTDSRVDVLRRAASHQAGSAAVALATTSADPWEPNPSLVKALPTRVYEVAIAYCRRLAAAGLPREEVEEAERLLIDEGYAKLNKRAKRVLTEDEQIELIDATWRIMREALSWRGMRA